MFLAGQEPQRWALLRTRRVLSQERALCRHGHSGPSSVALQKHSAFFFSQWHFDTTLYFMHFLTSALLSILTNKTKEKKKTGKRRWVDCQRRRSSRGVTSLAFPLKCKVTAIWEDADFKPFVEVDLALFFLFVCRKHYLMTT